VLYCAGKFKKVKGDAEMAQVIAALEAEHASATGSDEEDSVRQSGGGLSENCQRTYCPLR
jgi:hypothetical protein